VPLITKVVVGTAAGACPGRAAATRGGRADEDERLAARGEKDHGSSAREDVRRSRRPPEKQWTPPARVWAILALCFLVLALSSGLAFAAGATSDNQASSSGADPTVSAAQEPDGVEIEAARTETSDTYRLPDGAHETRVYGTPINYEDPEGDWTPIEEGLEEGTGGAITNGGNSFDLSLPQRLGAAPMRISSEGRWVSTELLGPESAPAELEDGTASYEAPGGGTSFELTGLADGVKEEIGIAGPSDPGRFSFALETSGGLTPGLTEEGAVEITDAEGKDVFTLPAPTVSDSALDSLPSSEAVAYELHADGEGGWLLTVAVDPGWLAQPGRTWPVEIDPTTVKAAPTLDCTIRGGRRWPNTGGCGEKGFKELQTGFWPTAKVVKKPLLPPEEYGNEQARSLLRFNLSSIPAKASVASATLGLYAPAAAVGTSGVEVLRVTEEWNNAVTWSYPKSSLFPWGFPASHEGGQFAPAPAQTITTAERGSGAGWWTFGADGMASLVQEWVSGQVPDYGLGVKLIDDSPPGCTGVCGEPERHLTFESSAATITEHRPYLSVVYDLPAHPTSGLAWPKEGTRTARRLKLEAAWIDNSVTEVTFQFREGKSGPFHTIPAELVQDAAGRPVSLPIVVSGEHQTKAYYFDAGDATATLRKKGGPVQVRALFTGPAEIGGYSVPVEAAVNHDIGGTKDATAPVGPGSVDLLTGDLTVSDTDVSIPVFDSSLEFSRTFNSREAGKPGVLGPGWQPGAPVEQAGGSEWRNVRVTEEKEEYEGETFNIDYATVTADEGGELWFEESGPGGSFITPPEEAGWTLLREGEHQIVLADPYGDRTTFNDENTGNEYLPTRISQAGGSTNATQMVWKLMSGGTKRLEMVIAPSLEGTTCTNGAEDNATTTPGCKALVFTYAPASYGERLQKITCYSPANGGPWDVADYRYDATGRLVAEWDPRISPVLEETYTYEPGGQIKTITPPGQDPWTMDYGAIGEEEADGRLMAVERASLVEASPTAKTTISYGVPVSGAAAPYEMGGPTIEQWGQQDIPLDATAVFPPDQVPTSSPPTSWSHATVYYMDTEGRLVDTATPPGAGTGAPSISTTETDEHGNVVRELTPDNRIRALEAGSGSVARSHELDTRRAYDAEGTQMEEEWGPTHQVRLSSGTLVQARLHKAVQYDKGWPGTGIDPHLPTRETTGALVGGEVLDQRVTETRYDWNLRKPTETIVNPGEGQQELKTVTAYNAQTGLVTETRQPEEAESAGPGTGAGTTKYYYYGINLGDLPAAENRLRGPPLQDEARRAGVGDQPSQAARNRGDVLRRTRSAHRNRRNGGDRGIRHTEPAAARLPQDEDHLRPRRAPDEQEGRRRRHQGLEDRNDLSTDPRPADEAAVRLRRSRMRRVRHPGDHDDLRRARPGQGIRRRGRRQIDDDLRHRRPTGEKRRRQGLPDAHLRSDLGAADQTRRFRRGDLHGEVRRRREPHRTHPARRPHREDDLRRSRPADEAHLHEDQLLRRKLHLARRKPRTVDLRPGPRQRRDARRRQLLLRQGRPADRSPGNADRRRMHHACVYLRPRLEQTLEDHPRTGPRGGVRDLGRHAAELRIRHGRPPDGRRADLRQLRSHHQPAGGGRRRPRAGHHLLQYEHGRDPGPERDHQQL
jgi:hypothetical protein